MPLVTDSPRLLVTEARILMRDGAALLADVAVPDDGELHPVLLVRTPYGRASLRAAHDPVGLARLGWAVVTQDVRGRFASEGEFAPFHQELADGADTVAWCAHQPWSDGRVAMTGASYNGATQWLAAAAGSPELKAISPVVSSLDYRDGWSYEGGAFRFAFMTSWALGFASSDPRAPAARSRRAAAKLDRWPGPTRRPADDPEVASLFPAYGHWASPEDREYWRAIDVRRRVRQMDLAGYHVAGWYDIFCEASIDAYQAMVRGSASEYSRRSQRLVIGPWTHTGVYFPGTGYATFGSAADGIARGIPQEMVAFLRDALDRRQVPSGVSIFILGTNRWSEFDSWPPPSKPSLLHLSSAGGAAGSGGAVGDGRLLVAAPEHAGVDRYRHDPADPVPNHGGRTLSPGLPLAGPIDQRVIESRPDVLVYTGDRLTHDLTVIGSVKAFIPFASSAERADVAVKLVDVHPDGTALNVVDSVQRTAGHTGRTRRVEVGLGSTAVTFRRGHRIRVEVSSANFPHLDCLPAATHSVHHGPRAGAYLLLPVVGGGVW